MNFVVEKPKKVPNTNHFGGKLPFQNQMVKDDPFDEIGGIDGGKFEVRLIT